MTNLTKKQRAALEALAEVLKEHNIQMYSNWYPISVYVGGVEWPQDEVLWIDTSDIGMYLTGETITKLLGQNPEPPQDPPGFEGTLDELNNLGIRK